MRFTFLYDYNYYWSVENILKLFSLQVLLVGGGAQIPKMIKTFKDKFPSSEVFSNISTDEVIACGAALQVSFFLSSEVSCYYDYDSQESFLVS